MIVLMPSLMTYSLIGETLHEAAGTAMLLLYIVHLLLHLKWWKAVPKGTYSVYRTVTTALDILLLPGMLLLPVSGILMSRHLFRFFRIPGTAALARTLHLVLSYWCFVLMSVHVGLHAEMIWKRITKNVKAKRVASVSAVLIAAAVSAYGAYAFINRGFPGYLILQTKFAFIDFSEPLIRCAADYVAVMVLFGTIGWSCRWAIGTGFPGHKTSHRDGVPDSKKGKNLCEQSEETSRKQL